MRINLCREEALACVIALEKTEKKKSYGWQKSVLEELLKAMGLNSKGGEG